MPEKPIAPPIKLPPEVAEGLRNQEATMVRARKDLQTLKKMGLETKALEDKLDWADSARKTLLKEFT